MEVYREVVESYEDGVCRVDFLRTETDVANSVYVSYEVIVKRFEEWSGDYSKMESEEYYVNVGEASAGYEKLVNERKGS